MTDFYGSVMETIHTDSAYKAIKDSKRSDIKMTLDESAKRILLSTDFHDEMSDKTKVKIIWFPIGFIYILYCGVVQVEC